MFNQMIMKSCDCVSRRIATGITIDVLVSLYVLPSWREVAVEYQRQGQELQFRSVLKEIFRT